MDFRRPCFGRAIFSASFGLAGFAQAHKLCLYVVALSPKAAEIRERGDCIGIVGRQHGQ